MKFDPKRDGRNACVAFSPGDGTRYSASATLLPWSVEGGLADEHYLVSIVSPNVYQRTYTVAGPGYGELIAEYLAEHFQPLAEGPTAYYASITGLSEAELRSICREGAFS